MNGTLNTEALDALPAGRVVLDRDDIAWQKDKRGTWNPSSSPDGGWTSEELAEEGPRLLSLDIVTTEDQGALASLVEWASRLRMDTPEDQAIADRFVGVLRRISRVLDPQAAAGTPDEGAPA